MESLRWILLGIGVLVVAGIYLWSRRPIRQERVEPRFENEIPSEPEPGDFDVGGDAALESETFAEVEPPRRSETSGSAPAWPDAIDRELEELSAAIKEERTQAPASSAIHPEGEEKIIVFYLIAPRGEPFQGSEMARAFDALGLEYGEMQIFHRMAPGALKRPVFGVANLTEPGTFDPANMDGFTTPGLSLFLQLPAPIDSLKAFDDLDDTAHKLASQLGGELRDEARNLLSRQRIENLREEVAEFERQQKLRQSSLR